MSFILIYIILLNIIDDRLSETSKPLCLISKNRFYRVSVMDVIFLSVSLFGKHCPRYYDKQIFEYSDDINKFYWINNLG